MGKCKEFFRLSDHAKRLARVYGIRRAALYLREEGISVEGAVWILLRQ